MALVYRRDRLCFTSLLVIKRLWYVCGDFSSSLQALFYAKIAQYVDVNFRFCDNHAKKIVQDFCCSGNNLATSRWYNNA